MSIKKALKKEIEELSFLIDSSNEFYNLSITSFALFLSHQQNKFIVFEENEDQAYKLYISLKNFLEFFNLPDNIVFLPSNETERMVAIFKILHSENKK